MPISDDLSASSARKRLRRGTGVAGALMLMVALGPTLVGSGTPGLGIIQVALLVVGTIAILVAWLGTRLLDGYRATAIMALNVIVLLAALELGTRVLLSLTQRPADVGKHPYYGSKPWARRFLNEEIVSLRKDYYRPFVMWKRGRTTGESVNVDADGRRLTPGARCSADAYRVWLLGGSTMWGLGSPDWGTIPAYLQGTLAGRTSSPVCVINLADRGYTSMQELVYLVTLLGSDQTPDLLLSLDGVNDVRTAADNGAAGLHYSLSQIAAKLEEVQPPLANRLRRSRSKLVRLIAPPLPPDSQLVLYYRQRGIGVDSLADQVVARYLERNRMMRALAREYGFDYAFFWQPVIWEGHKALTRDERRYARNAPGGSKELFRAVYWRMRAAAVPADHVYDISRVFDEEAVYLYIDWDHVVPEGNALIAARMLALLDERAGGRLIPRRVGTLPAGAAAARQQPGSTPLRNRHR